MKKPKGLLKVLILFLLLFYLSIFVALEYNSKNISATPADRWPLASQVLSGLAGFIKQVSNRPQPFLTWWPQAAGSQAGEFIQSQSTLNEGKLVLDYQKSSRKISAAEYLEEAFKAGAFNLEVFWHKFIDYFSQLK